MTSWKETLFTSSDHAKSVLLENINQLGVALCSINCYNHSGFFLASRFRTAVDSDYLLRFNLNHQGAITYINVHESFRGQKLSLLLVKAGLAHAYDMGSDSVLIDRASSDGPSFWPSLGAVPLGKPFPDIAGYLEDHYLSQPALMSEAALADITETARLFRADEEAGWYRLASSKATLVDGYSIKNDVFRSLCYADNMVLHLRESKTRALLKHHLGPTLITT